MAEQKRGCGYRKIGGIYLVCGGRGIECKLLPYPLDVCPVCSAGIKFCRGWTWISRSLFIFSKDQCGRCPLMGGCAFTGSHDRLGLIWIGERHYKRTEDFNSEAVQMGISRRIKAIPRGFKVGETWVALAHIKAVRKEKPVPVGIGALPNMTDYEESPGIFTAFRPSRIEFVVTEEMLKDPEVQERIEKQGLTPVVVPDIQRHRIGKEEE